MFLRKLAALFGRGSWISKRRFTTTATYRTSP